MLPKGEIKSVYPYKTSGAVEEIKEYILHISIGSRSQT